MPKEPDLPGVPLDHCFSICNIPHSLEYWFPPPKPASPVTERTQVHNTAAVKLDIDDELNKPPAKQITPVEPKVISYQTESPNQICEDYVLVPNESTNSDPGHSPNYWDVEKETSPLKGTQSITALKTGEYTFSHVLREIRSKPAVFVEQTSVSHPATYRKHSRASASLDERNNDIGDGIITITRKRVSNPCTGYEDSKGLARRMGLDPENCEKIRLRRKHVAISCTELGYELDKPFLNWPPAEMETIVDLITPDLKETYGSWWSTDLTRDLIHSISLDAVRNRRARESSGVIKYPIPWPPAIKGLSLPPLTAATMLPRHPSNLPPIWLKDDFPKSHEAVPRSTLTYIEDSPSGSSSHDVSPAMGLMSHHVSKKDNSNISPTPKYIKDSPSSSSFRHVSTKRVMSSKVSKKANSKKPTTCRQLPAQRSSIAVYTANHSPFYAPINDGLKGFLDTVAKAMTWSADECLFYCPTGILPIVWMPVRTGFEFKYMTNTCHDFGVFLKSVSNDYANSEDIFGMFKA